VRYRLRLFQVFAPRATAIPRRVLADLSSRKIHLCQPLTFLRSYEIVGGWIVRTAMEVTLLIGFSALSLVTNSSAPIESAAAT
jgi:hypothetical protein